MSMDREGEKERERERGQRGTERERQERERRERERQERERRSLQEVASLFFYNLTLFLLLIQIKLHIDMAQDVSSSLQQLQRGSR